MKMKINNLNISQIIILFIFCFQPTINFKVRLMGYNSFDNNSKDSRYFQSQKNSNNYESPEIHHSPGDWDANDDTEMSNLEIRNQIYNHNTEPILRTYDSEGNSSSTSSSASNDVNNNGGKFISRMINGPPHHIPANPMVPVPVGPGPMVASSPMGSCPCAALVKCQPCGLIPDLDFTPRPRINCPCAPKLNCPACPPLSLIHEIAAKKVKYYFK